MQLTYYYFLALPLSSSCLPPAVEEQHPLTSPILLLPYPVHPLMYHYMYMYVFHRPPLHSTSNDLLKSKDSKPLTSSVSLSLLHMNILYAIGKEKIFVKEENVHRLNQILQNCAINIMPIFKRHSATMFSWQSHKQRHPEPSLFNLHFNKKRQWQS